MRPHEEIEQQMRHRSEQETGNAQGARMHGHLVSMTRQQPRCGTYRQAKNQRVSNADALLDAEDPDGEIIEVGHDRQQNETGKRPPSMQRAQTAVAEIDRRASGDVGDECRHGWARMVDDPCSVGRQGEAMMRWACSRDEQS